MISLLIESYSVNSAWGWVWTDSVQYVDVGYAGNDTRYVDSGL